MPRKKIQESIKEKPVWLKYTEDEVKAIILKLANKGNTAEKIGLILRDQYGIPNVKLYNLRIKKVLGDKYKDPNVINLRKKVENIEEHNKQFKHDEKANRSLNISKAFLKKRESYLAKKG
jgi:small subunit ribosomal protein S15